MCPEVSRISNLVKSYLVNFWKAEPLSPIKPLIVGPDLVPSTGGELPSLLCSCFSHFSKARRPFEIGAGEAKVEGGAEV